MPKSRTILALGFFIALLPVLGFPHAWESFFEVASGLLIVFLSFLISVDRRLTMKSKAEKRHLRKRALVEAQMASVPTPEVHPNYGRRATDKRLPVRDADIEEGAEISETPENITF
jgi:hypothetical protein